MRTFLFFIGLFLSFLLMTFVIWKNSSVEEMIKVVIATLWAYIVYNLIKEEDK